MRTYICTSNRHTYMFIRGRKSRINSVPDRKIPFTYFCKLTHTLFFFLLLPQFNLFEFWNLNYNELVVDCRQLKQLILNRIAKSNKHFLNFKMHLILREHHATISLPMRETESFDQLSHSATAKVTKVTSWR